jgi:hypothetical protein
LIFTDCNIDPCGRLILTPDYLACEKYFHGILFANKLASGNTACDVHVTSPDVRPLPTAPATPHPEMQNRESLIRVNPASHHSC